MQARILIIEDNADNLELMRYLLSAHGYATLTAENGADGVAAALAEAPDLILCDVQLPDFDGFEVARRLKDSPELRDKPLVAVTALAMVGDRDRVLAARFDGYLTKPIAPETFVADIEVYLDESLHSRLAPRTPAVLAAQEHPIPTREQILVVDNLQENLDLAISLLSYAGYRVATARSVHEGLELARRLLPDLILSDVNMEESGFTFIRAIKEDQRLRTIPFIFLTSSLTDESARMEGLELGAARFLFRPIEAESLLDEIRASLESP